MEQQVVQQNNGVITLTTILNYDKYQLDGTDNGTLDSTTDGQQTVQQTDTIKKDNKGKKVKNLIYSDDFEKFWIAYPIKKGKAEGYEAYCKAIKKTTPEVLLAGAIKYSAEVRASGTTYIKYAQGWINNHRREDETIDTTPTTQDQWIAIFQKITGREFAEKYGQEKRSEINDLLARQI